MSYITTQGAGGGVTRQTMHVMRHAFFQAHGAKTPRYLAIFAKPIRACEG
jgi:hypothetical protein